MNLLGVSRSLGIGEDLCLFGKALLSSDKS